MKMSEYAKSRGLTISLISQKMGGIEAGGVFVRDQKHSYNEDARKDGKGDDGAWRSDDGGGFIHGAVFGQKGG